MANEFDPEKPPVGRWAASGIVVSLGGLVSLTPDQCLHWKYQFDRARWKTPPDDLLDQFVALWTKPPSAIVRFASRWGPLRINEAGAASNAHASSGVEPLEWWRYLSRRAQAVLRIAKALESGEIGEDDDWDYLSSDHRESGIQKARFGFANHRRWEFSGFAREHSGYSDAISYAKASIASEVSDWLSIFDVKLSVVWDAHTAWQISMRYGGRVLSAVALQLALAIAHGERMLTCSGCGIPYKRPRGKRLPNVGHANFCPQCEKTRAPQRAAEKRYRENRREARRLHEQGVNIREIADKLKRTTTTVRGWLKEEGR